MTGGRRHLMHRPGDSLLRAAVVLTTLFHGTLLATGSYTRTYDAYVHMFFADHYARGWFTTWEPRWYTGFTVTSYPPGTHQLVALGSKLIGLDWAFVAVQLAGVILVVLGVYRLTAMLGSRRAAGIAALLAAVSTSIGEAVHVFGQLPTICALGLLLNSLPHVHGWIVAGHRRDLTTAVALLAGTTALHHVTTLFGAVFFLGPVIVAALLERFRRPAPGESTVHPGRVRRANLVPLVARRMRRVVRPLARASVLGVLVVVVLLGVVLPYWVWSRTDPIVQIPIPHGSRADFLEDRNAGLVFWLVPWGPMLLALPYALSRGLRSTAWPYAASVALLTVLGTGGTTPVPRLLLGGAFDILTLDRFTFWATILVLPFAGALAERFFAGDLSRRIAAAIGTRTGGLVRLAVVVVVIVSTVFTVNLTHLRRMQPDPIDTTPIVAFLERDQHWQWRYLTLGFGDQMARLSAQTTAQTVDGNYHSARRLPELITTPVERLEGAKFRGVPGLGSLQQFLAVPEKYHLKFVFSNDQFYDPLLEFSGWRRLGRLENGIVVWEREDVPPMPAVIAHPEPPAPYRLMWGLLPPAALVAAAGAAAVRMQQGPGSAPSPARRSPLRTVERWLESRAVIPSGGDEPARSWKDPVHRLLGRLRPSPGVIRLLAAGLAVAVAVGVAAAVRPTAPDPGDVVIAFYDDLDFRRFEAAWQRLDPATRPSLSDYLVQLSVTDGLLASYASLDAIEVQRVSVEGDRAAVDAELTYVTSVAEYRSQEVVELRLHDGGWGIVLELPAATEPAERLARRTTTDFLPMGRRTATSGTTDYDDVLDRPELQLSEARVVYVDDRPAAVGTVRNVDADPASVTVTVQLVADDGAVAAAYNASTVVAHSLLPGEASPFRIDFEGVAGRDTTGTFHPGDFVAVGPIDDLAGVNTYAAAIVTGRGLERPVVLQNLEVDVDAHGIPRLTGAMLNLGTADATVVALLVSLYDRDGSLIWVDWIVVPDAARPGAAVPFAAELTARNRLTPVDAPGAVFANGLAHEAAATTATPLLEMPHESGYAGLTVQPVTFLRSSS